MKNISSNIISALLFVSLVSCEHKDIVWPGESVREVTVKFEWDNAPDADPEGMSLYFFPQSPYGEVWKFDITGREGGTVELPTGDYQMVAYNTGVQGVKIEGTYSYESIMAAAMSTGKEGVVTPVGTMYGATVSHIEVTECGVRYITSAGTIKECGQSLVRCIPDSITTDYTVIVKNVEGTAGVSTVRAYLEGVGSGIFLSDLNVSGVPSTVAFPLSVDNDHNLFYGKSCAFSSFGKRNSYDLQIAVTFSNHKTIARKYDVTAQVVNSHSMRNVLIIVDGLSIPHPGDPDYPDDDIGGIDTDVEGWVTIETDILVDIIP